SKKTGGANAMAIISIALGQSSILSQDETFRELGHSQGRELPMANTVPIIVKPVAPSTALFVIRDDLKA
ncbi:MAG: hypothetical protein AB7V39_12940, partial [Nitrospiraceae bacterium]